MLRVNVFKQGDLLVCEGHTEKQYKWEGESDFGDIDIPAVSWAELLNRLEWSGITEMSLLRFANGTQITFSEFRQKVQNDADSLSAFV